jgi:hypothetical protein
MNKGRKSNLQVDAGPVIWFRGEGLLLQLGKITTIPKHKKKTGPKLILVGFYEEFEIKLYKFKNRG